MSIGVRRGLTGLVITVAAVTARWPTIAPQPAAERAQHRPSLNTDPYDGLQILDLGLLVRQALIALLNDAAQSLHLPGAAGESPHPKQSAKHLQLRLLV